MNEPPGRDGQSTIDDLLVQAKKLQQRVEKQKSPQSAVVDKPLLDVTDTLRSFNENISFLRRTGISIKETAIGLYERFFSPVWNILSPLVRWIWRIYGSLWLRFAYRTDPSDGKRVISRSRASLIVALTILFLSVFTPSGLGSRVRFVTTEPVLDGILMIGTLTQETFYLNDTQEINPERNEHSVRGCRKIGQCSEKDATYFRVRPRLSHDFWKFWTYGNFFYIPDHVVAPIAPGVNHCEVTYYGYRLGSSWISRLLRSLQIYPTMLEADCRYIGLSAENILESSKAYKPIEKTY